MSPGSYISFALHLGFVGWLVFDGDFPRKPSEMSVADVSVVSSDLFDIMVNNSSPDISTEIPSAEAVSVTEDAVGPSAPEFDVVPVQVVQSLTQISSGDTLPLRRPEPVAPVQDVVILPPVELQAPMVEDSVQTTLETSLPPKPRPAQRIAPAAIDAPDMEMDIGAESREAAAPQEAPVEVAQEQEAQTREAAAPEIVTEAEKPSATPVVTANAPERSLRPRSRPAPRPVPASEPAATEPEAPEIDPVTAALSAALMASEITTRGAETAPALSAPKIADVIMSTVENCWSIGHLSTMALSTNVEVEMKLAIDRKPIESSIRMIGFEGGDKTSAETVFAAFKSGISKCGAKGFDLSKDDYETWRYLSFTIDLDKMRVR
jgi:hypothetical protein